MCPTLCNARFMYSVPADFQDDSRLRRDPFDGCVQTPSTFATETGKRARTARTRKRAEEGVHYHTISSLTRFVRMQDMIMKNSGAHAIYLHRNAVSGFAYIVPAGPKLSVSLPLCTSTVSALFLSCFSSNHSWLQPCATRVVCTYTPFSTPCPCYRQDSRDV